MFATSASQEQDNAGKKNNVQEEENRIRNDLSSEPKTIVIEYTFFAVILNATPSVATKGHTKSRAVQYALRHSWGAK